MFVGYKGGLVSFKFTLGNNIHLIFLEIYVNDLKKEENLWDKLLTFRIENLLFTFSCSETDHSLVNLLPGKCPLIR